MFCRWLSRDGGGLAGFSLQSQINRKTTTCRQIAGATLVSPAFRAKLRRRLVDLPSKTNKIMRNCRGDPVGRPPSNVNIFNIGRATSSPLPRIFCCTTYPHLLLSMRGDKPLFQSAIRLAAPTRRRLFVSSRRVGLACKSDRSPTHLALLQTQYAPACQVIHLQIHPARFRYFLLPWR